MALPVLAADEQKVTAVSFPPGAHTSRTDPRAHERAGDVARLVAQVAGSPDEPTVFGRREPSVPCLDSEILAPKDGVVPEFGPAAWVAEEMGAVAAVPPVVAVVIDVLAAIVLVRFAAWFCAALAAAVEVPALALAGRVGLPDQSV